MSAKQRKRNYAVQAFPHHRRSDHYSMYRLVCIIGIFIIAGLLVIIGAQYIQQLRAKQELAEFEARLLEHKARQEALELEIERLQDLDYIEMLARERLGLVKPGEIIFQFED